VFLSLFGEQATRKRLSIATTTSATTVRSTRNWQVYELPMRKCELERWQQEIVFKKQPEQELGRFLLE